MRQGLWRIGVVDGFEYEQSVRQGRCRVRLIDKRPGILTKPFPVVMSFAGVDKFFVMPKIGDRVAILADENCDDGIIIGAVYTKQTTPPVSTSDKHHILFDDGTFLEYDKAAKILTVDCKGDISVRASGNVKITGKKIDLNP